MKKILPFNKERWVWVVIILILPLMLCGAIQILPTFDDWTSLVAPSKEPLFTKERFLFYGYHWRPFDSVFGAIVGINPKLLFPTLNHICVVMGHLGCTFMVYYLAGSFHFRCFSKNLSTLFYFLSPGMLATVLAVDGLNQTYASFWGLAATIAYIKCNGTWKYPIWILLIFISALCKENGLMWAIITPTLCFAFGIIRKNTLKRDLMTGCAVICVYALMILLFPSDITIHPEYIPSVGRNIIGIFKWLFSTWMAVDFVYLLSKPDRNIWMAAITMALSIPLLYELFIVNRKALVTKPFIGLAICFLMAVIPHLLTVFSMMHTYAGLCFAAWIIAYLTDSQQKSGRLTWAWIMYLIVATFVDIHLWYTSCESGRIGKEMAQEAVRKTGLPVNSVFCVIIEEDYQKVSSFRVIPSEAFGWGIAAQYETDYIWPKVLNDTTISNHQRALTEAESIGRESIRNKGFDCAWIIQHRHIKVIR